VHLHARRRGRVWGKGYEGVILAVPACPQQILDLTPDVLHLVGSRFGGYGARQPGCISHEYRDVHTMRAAVVAPGRGADAGVRGNVVVRARAYAGVID
jgi:hypothetical protein